MKSPLIATGLPLGIAIVVAIARKPIVGVYIGVLSVPLERSGFAAGGADVTPSKGLLLLTGLACAGHLLFSEERKRIPATYGAFVGLLLVMALGLTTAVKPFTTLKILVQWSAYLAMSIYIAQAARHQVMRILGCLAVSGAILGALAVVSAKPQQVVGQAATGRAEGSFTHPAVLAFFLVLVLPPTIALGFRAARWVRGPALVAAALALAGIVLSLTRGAILGAALSLLIMLAWAPFRRVAAALLVGLIIFSAFNVNAIERSQQLRVIGDRLETITQTQATADNERLLIWAKTPAIIADHPFIGVGSGNFVEISPAYGIVEFGGLPFVHAHDVMLTIAAENGLVGLGFFLAFIGGVILTAARVFKWGRESPAFPFALAVFAALAGLFVNGLTDYPPSALVIMAMIMIEVGAFFSLARDAGGDGPAPHTTPGKQVRSQLE